MGFLTHWLRLQRSQWYDRKKLGRLQLRALRHLIRHAYETVPFYHRLLGSASVDPSQIRSLNDLMRLPIISKEEVRASPLTERLSSEFSPEECLTRRTSGSTGQPLQILEENNAVQFMRAYQLRRILSYGFAPWDKIAVLDPRRVEKPARGHAFAGALTRMLPGGGLFDVPMRSPKEQLEAIQQLKPKGIWALPSAMRAVGNILDQQQVSDLKLRAILSWGELLDKKMREFTETKFRAPIYDGYGAVEVAPLGGLAWECAEHGFHVNADCVILEFLRDGEPVSPGEQGEVVATSLYRYAMPAIRYRLNDYAVPTDTMCSCGRGLPLIQALEGRRIDCLVGENGELISPFRVIIALEQVEQLARYQIIQESHDRIVVNVEVTAPLPSNISQEIATVCRSLVGQNVSVTIREVSAITQESGRKFQPVICKLQK